MSTIYIACYPKVGSEFFKEKLIQGISRCDAYKAIAKEHNFNIKWVEENVYIYGRPQGLRKDTKIIYLCANPMNAVVSLLKKHQPTIWGKYNPSLKYTPLHIKILKSYSNIFACSARGWTGPSTLFSDEDYIEELLTPEDITDISLNFMSYMINDDLLGYKKHFDLWTKTPLPYERCIVKYEHLAQPATGRLLEEFLGIKKLSLQNISDDFRERSSCYKQTSEFKEKLEESYGELAAEIEQLSAFTIIESVKGVANEN